MTRTLLHRGPDGSGVFLNRPVGLGHTRLSIIDPEGGHQPMLNQAGTVAVTFNGEIYNFRELMRELQTAGFEFHTRSDTEVVLHAWENWGKACVEHFRGMFAFGVVDWNKRTLFLARDHLGIKPLCYLRDEAQFAFASEIQALRALPDFKSDIDIQALDHYVTLGYIPAPRSIYRSVSKLPPAHRMTVAFDGRTEGPERYWSFAFEPDESKSVEDWATELEDVLKQSVKTHLVSDVPFGAFLSGGMDSTAVVGWMSEYLDQPVRTFTIGFKEQGYDESPFAQEASQRWKTEHHVEVVSPEAVDILPSLVRHYGEPFGDSSAIPTYYVSKFAREHVSMVLSGDGGDEALGGYRRYHAWRRWVCPEPIQRPLWKKLTRPLLASIFPRQFPSDLTSRPQTVDGWLWHVQMFPQSVRTGLWRPEYAGELGVPPQFMEAACATAKSWQPESFAQYMDYTNYLPNDILAKVDTASMMHGLEVRTPLVDVKVAEFVSRIPARLTNQSGAGGWEGKPLMRRILRQYFPEDFINRPKMGFMVPLEKWFGPSGELRPMIDERLGDRQAKVLQYFRPESMRELCTVPPTRKAADQLWQLLFLELWLEQSA